jgi:hypothetical protein
MINNISSYTTTDGLSIKPLVNSVINLGLPNYEFRSLWLYTPDGSYSTRAINVNRSEVLIGKQPNLSLGYGVAGISLNDISMKT